MPKRTDISSIMIIGAGPIVIGQACEFDYSGAQACKALREEGYRVILVNSNPATIMTDPGLADATYIEPITPDVVAKIIEKERPDALLPTMGGQTALNTSLALEEMGVLDKFNVGREAIDKPEINIGIGIATGEVIAGYAGTQDRATYTCIGDKVNLAARLEAHTKIENCSILIDNATRDAIIDKNNTEVIGYPSLKGISEPVAIFSVSPS